MVIAARMGEMGRGQNGFITIIRTVLEGAGPLNIVYFSCWSSNYACLLFIISYTVHLGRIEGHWSGSCGNKLTFLLRLVRTLDWSLEIVGVFLLPSSGLFVNRNENCIHLNFVTSRLCSLFIWGFWALCQTLQIETLLVAIVLNFLYFKVEGREWILLPTPSLEVHMCLRFGQSCLLQTLIFHESFSCNMGAIIPTS